MTLNGPAVRAIREAQKLGLRALSDLTGLNRGYLSRLETGKVRQPAEEKVQRIADALQVPPEAIDPREETP
ncbi:helix-turn-helix transcriptional regulator [Streptomyces sp. NPDC006207]